MDLQVAQGICTYDLNLDEERSVWLANTPNKEAMDLLFYVTEMGYFHAFRGFFTDREAKNEYYLLYTVSGRGILKQKGQKFVLRAQDAVLIHCMEHQYYATASDEPWVHYWVHFNGIGAPSYYQLINEDDLMCVHIEDPDAFTANLRGILDNCGAADMRQSVISSMHITNLLTMMVMGRYAVRNVPILTRHEEQLKMAVQYIQNNYAVHVSVTDVADRAGLSPSYFARLFRQYTGLTPYEYLLNYRVNQAKEMLRDTNMPVAEVGTSVGFTDACNFSRTFRRITGSTPNSYRKVRPGEPAAQAKPSDLPAAK